MNNLNRTFTGRTTHYSPDGYGRDWYIMHNNGGICKESCTTGFNNEKSHNLRSYSPPQPKMEAKFTRYTSDGTGRDAYIHHNYGGLVSGYGSKPFYTTLRTWSPIKVLDYGDGFVKSQQMWRKKRARKNSCQEELSQRLSSPKKRADFKSPVKEYAPSKGVKYPRVAYKK